MFILSRVSSLITLRFLNNSLWATNFSPKKLIARINVFMGAKEVSCESHTAKRAETHHLSRFLPIDSFDF